MDFDNLLDKYFGTLSLTKSHCEIFYYLSLLMVLLGTVAIGGSIFTVYKKMTDKGNNKTQIAFFSLLSVALMGFIYWFAHYLYRILYSMCIKTIKE